MEEVAVNSLDRWGWECPTCGHWNEIEEDPYYLETVDCESTECMESFKPIEE